MENILVLDRLCTWRSFSRLLPTGAATVLVFAGSLGIARGSTVGCPSSPITFAMASQLDVPASDAPCEFTISDFLLAPSSEGYIFFSFLSDAGPIATTGFAAENTSIFGPLQATLCYSAEAGGCNLEISPNNLGSSLGLGPFGVIDYVSPTGLSAYGELTLYLSGTVGGQPATLGLAIYDVRAPLLSNPNGALIAIPEPSTYATLGICLLAIVVFRRKIGRTVL